MYIINFTFQINQLNNNISTNMKNLNTMSNNNNNNNKNNLLNITGYNQNTNFNTK